MLHLNYKKLEKFGISGNIAYSKLDIRKDQYHFHVSSANLA